MHTACVTSVELDIDVYTVSRQFRRDIAAHTVSRQFGWDIAVYRLSVSRQFGWDIAQLCTGCVCHVSLGGT